MLNGAERRFVFPPESPALEWAYAGGDRWFCGVAGRNTRSESGLVNSEIESGLERCGDRMLNNPPAAARSGASVEDRRTIVSSL